MPSKILQLYRDSFSGLHRNSWLLASVQLVNRAGTMVVPFMSMYLTQHHGVSMTKAGFVLACFGMGSIAGSLLGGRLADRYGFYRIMVLTLFLGGLSFIALSFIQSYWWICFGTFVMAVINEAFRPASMAAISAYSAPESLTRSGSLVRLSVNLGWAFGAAVGGWIAAHNYQLLFWVDGITNLSAAGLILLALPRVEPARAHTKEKERDSNSISPFRDHFFLRFVLLNCLFGICFFQLFTTLPVYLKAELALGETAIGWVMAINGLLIAAFEMVAVFSLEHIRKLKLIAAGTFVTGLAFVVFNVLPLPALQLALISSVILTAGEILAMPFLLSYTMSRSTPATIGQYASLYTMSYSVAHVLGSYSGGAVADRLGFSVLWWSVGGLSTIVALTYYRMHKVEARYPPERYAPRPASTSKYQAGAA
ncbi:MAG: MFS transporter [Saprospiraceae bacterium]|nr:MFS transporter [Saprospiraceae bacterium]